MRTLEPSQKPRTILGFTVSERDAAGLFELVEARQLGRFRSDMAAERAVREYLARKGAKHEGSKNEV